MRVEHCLKFFAGRLCRRQRRGFMLGEDRDGLFGGRPLAELRLVP
jgi:hypothetical protein